MLGPAGSELPLRQPHQPGWPWCCRVGPWRPFGETGAVLGHLGVNVSDLEQARRYYAALMPALDFELFLDDADQFAYRPARSKPGTFLFFYPSAPSAANTPHSGDATGLQHLAFMVPTRSRVGTVHELVADLASRFGGRVVNPPADYPQYPPPYYAVFWHDPDGIMLEAVCHYDRD